MQPKSFARNGRVSYQYLPAAIVLEGPQAGGHLGFKESQIDDVNYSLEELLPQVVAEVVPFETKHNIKIPVYCGRWSLLGWRYLSYDGTGSLRGANGYSLCDHYRM